MVKYAQESSRGVLLSFWDGESRDTKDMIETATKLGMKVKVFRY